MSVVAASDDVTPSPKSSQKKDGNDIVLIPQPSDDPEDPLVSTHAFEKLQWLGVDSAEPRLTVV
jgi:hypothetical protein